MKYKALIFEELSKEISAFLYPKICIFKGYEKEYQSLAPLSKTPYSEEKTQKSPRNDTILKHLMKISGVSFLRNFQKRVSGCPFPVQTSERIFQNRVSFRSANSKYMRRIFEKHPPEMLSRFKQVKGIFPKHPYFFFSQFKQVKGMFFKSQILGVQIIPLCPNE